ncbi:MAG: META domain-containing protein [bacterium]|nr:META domain-containing protein [bacterium]
MERCVVVVAALFVLSGCAAPEAGTETTGVSDASTILVTPSTTATSTTSTTATSTVPPTVDDGPMNGTTEITGEWRLAFGATDGVQFADGTTGGFFIVFGPDRVDYPVNCNRASAQLTIENGSFTLGDTSVTAAGCGEPTEGSVLLETAFHNANHIATDGDHLVLTGSSSELRFVRPERSVTLGELPLTSAGMELTFDVPDGRQRASYYLIASLPEYFDRGAWWVLTAGTDDTKPTVTRWEEANIESTPGPAGPGQVTVVLPDNIHVGDWALCSPFWEPAPYCFTLPVRLPSAPWFVTAGGFLNPTTLYDADGTSQQLNNTLVGTAFYVDGRLIWQPSEEPDEIAIDASGSNMLYDTGQLLDVQIVGGRTVALVSDSDGSSLIDVDEDERWRVGPAAEDGELADDVVVLRVDQTTVEAYSVENTSLLWRMEVDPMALLNVHDGTVRIDTMRDIQADAGADPYFQYVDTQTVDLRSGKVLESVEWEVAIPLEGDSINKPCGFSDFDGELILCSHPDGRIVGLGVYGGDSTTIAYGALMASFAREGD